MSVPTLVETYYDRLWNRGEFEAAADLLAGDIRFRGSLGEDVRGPDAVLHYVRSMHEALSEYAAEILDCVSEDDRAFAKMRFAGKHVGRLRGFEPTGRPLHWLGAALFRFADGKIADIWVLGDLAGLDAMLTANQLAKARDHATAHERPTVDHHEEQ